MGPVNGFSINCGLIYFASVAVAVDSSHMTASSALWSRFNPPSNFVDGHVTTIWLMVCCWPQSQEGDWRDPIYASLHLMGLDQSRNGSAVG